MKDTTDYPCGIKSFRRKLKYGIYTFPLIGIEVLNKIPDEWIEDHPKKYHQAVKELNEYCDAIIVVYDELVKTARRRLY